MSTGVLNEFTRRGFNTTEEELAAVISSTLDHYAAPGSAMLTERENNFLDVGGLPSADGDVNVVATVVTSSTRIISESYTADRVAELLDVDISRVRHRAAAGSLYQISLGRRRYFPRWQFQAGAVLPGLSAVLAAAPDPVHPLSLSAFMTAPNPDLENMSPANWLVTGGSVERVAFEIRGLAAW
ncbi:hypothetical protein LWF01_12645 [Saxibacter everestensis]|uniref:DNA-binding protein n=1 Tax=Saxibacter everestensis TaxID=2909229 RepID=A0ABY8QRC9_9MICO|nr:hypothetical protein LWF01_12645 [Brevibacteriaceae bacterium ZFBP1038]